MVFLCAAPATTDTAAAAAAVATPEGAWWPVYERQAGCAPGYGMCVSVKHDVVVVSCRSADGAEQRLDVHSLSDGSLVRSIGVKGVGKVEFDMYDGGLCMTPDGDDVLVAEAGNHRVQQLRISDGHDSWVRFIGQGVLVHPVYLDCSADKIAVSNHRDRVTILSLLDGCLLTHLGLHLRVDCGSTTLNCPAGVRFLADGSGVVVTDSRNNRLWVLNVEDGLARLVCSKLQEPLDVLACTADGGFLVCNTGSHCLQKVSKDGSVVGQVGTKGRGSHQFITPTTLAALPDGGFVVRERRGERFQVFRDGTLRFTWLIACFCLGSV